MRFLAGLLLLVNWALDAEDGREVEGVEDG
jgi:hypothetical protein